MSKNGYLIEGTWYEAKEAFGGYFHGWDINTHQYRFKLTDEQHAEEGLYLKIDKEIQEAVGAIFRKHYKEQYEQH